MYPDKACDRLLLAAIRAPRLSEGIGARREPYHSAHQSVHARRCRTTREAPLDFDDSPAEAEFRAEVRAWLEQHAEPRKIGRIAELDPQARLERARRFLAAKGAKGYSAITAP